MERTNSCWHIKKHLAPIRKPYPLVATAQFGSRLPHCWGP